MVALPRHRIPKMRSPGNTVNPRKAAMGAGDDAAAARGVSHMLKGVSLEIILCECWHWAAASADTITP
jgi:hypothetical protein